LGRRAAWRHCRGGPWGGGGTAPVASWSLLYVRAGRKQEEGERRGKKKKKEKKGKNMEDFSNLENI
jgi:hypothetical protein